MGLQPAESGPRLARCQGPPGARRPRPALTPTRAPPAGTPRRPALLATVRAVSVTTGPRTIRGRVRVEPGAKRLRAYLGGELVADTIHPTLVWEAPYYPTYYFPVADVRSELLLEE